MGQSTYIRRGENVSRDQLREARRFPPCSNPFRTCSNIPSLSYASSICPPNRPETPMALAFSKRCSAPVRPYFVPRPTVRLSKGRSLAHAARMLASPPVGRANDFSARLGASLFLPPIRDEPRLKMQICCRMQSEASQPASQPAGRERERGATNGPSAEQALQSTHSC